MKIKIDEIPVEGLGLEETLSPARLDLNTDTVKFLKTINIKAQIFKLSDAVRAEVNLSTLIQLTCSRCLREFEIEFAKKFNQNYPLKGQETFIDLDDGIREEMILEYPIKALCKPDCKGLCSGCGNNLNEGGCSCAFT